MVYDRRELEALFPSLINDGRFFGRTLQPARVTKLFRTELIRSNMVYCDERVSLGEDMQITFPVILDVGKLCVVRDFFPYHYWINQKSITGQYDRGYMEKVSFWRNGFGVLAGRRMCLIFRSRFGMTF